MLLVQLPSLANVLPQARAETSNTGSNRKEGAVYGFLAGEAVESRVLSFVELFSISKWLPPVTAILPMSIARPVSRSRWKRRSRTRPSRPWCNPGCPVE